MVATVGLFVYTGANAATESTVQTEISFLSEDSADTASGDRAAHPVTCGTNSYVKHLRLKFTAAPDNAVTNFLVWTDGSGAANVALRGKLAQGTGGATPGSGDATPVSSAMTGDADAYGWTSGAKGQWDASSYSTINHVTKALLLQLQPAAAASPGNWTETISYSYDET
jgi:type 1 fimbria pilin